MHAKKGKWSRRTRIASLLSLGFSAVLVYVAFSRLHFSSQTPWPLSQLQWNHGVLDEFDGTRPEIIGHRGSAIPSLSGESVIGNTHNAIARGIAAGVDWIELDVRLSGGPDEELVVFHDERIDRKTSGAGAVSDLTVSEMQSATIHVPHQERILTLEDAFANFHDEHARWIFDVKAKGIESQVVGWIEDKIENGQLSPSDVIIFGTYDVLIDYAGCGFALGYTATWGNTGNRLRMLFTPSAIIGRCHSLQCDYLVVPEIFASESLIDMTRKEGFEVWVYGVDDQRDFNCLAERGVSGFIVDSPQKFVVQRDALP